jgi:hypothetical protein
VCFREESSPADRIKPADPLRGSRIECTIELLAEVPIAASLGGIRPIPAQVERQRRRHSSGGDEATKIALGANRHFAAVGLDRKHWRDAGAIRRIFKQAFERAGLPNYNPHSFRHTLAVFGEKICRTPEEWKAYSQNFGHFSPMTTFNSYGPVAAHRQAEILNALVDAQPIEPSGPIQTVRLEDEQVRLILNQLAKAGVKEDA